MDRRQQKTREAIFTAFNTLLSEKKYSNITVQEIIDEANVGRSTFYSHFETKDALLKEMCTDLFDHVVSNHAESETTHDFSASDSDTDSMITHILYHLRDNRRNIVGILSGESGELFLRYFKQYLCGIFTEQLKDRVLNKDVPVSFLINHISCSFVEMIIWWIQNNMKQSPEELQQYFSAVILPIM
ncbi:MAG TPA: TetR/AcrR family transcriptional regulator [Spirochaetia bacterium]|nr:TetR/AcrR family transcriptional regulator [Spirochaetia bacterium]HRV27199.1 TetR/AcrR family transcriptional regulator [Spirochaetia bacterium]